MNKLKFIPNALRVKNRTQRKALTEIETNLKCFILYILF